MKLRIVGAACAVSLLASCAMLSAEAPLFTVADQDSAFVLAEGLWAAKEPDCKVDAATSAPGDHSCVDWARIRRASDGSWEVSFEGESESDGPLRLIVAAAAPRGTHPLDRLRALTDSSGSAPAHGESVVLAPADAAVRIVAALREWGYLE